MDSEVIEVLKEIRDEAKQTNVRLESLEGHVESLERRLGKGFDALAERIELVTRRQTDSELRLASEVLSLAGVTREVRDLLSSKLEDHHMVLQHESRLRAIEDRMGNRPSE